MLISDLTQHGESKKSHLVTTKFNFLKLKLAKSLPFILITFNYMSYI
jgi:hypothetical protein